MRESSSWRQTLMTQLRREGFPDPVMDRDVFCRVELGLRFLTEHFPGEPVGALQPLLSGYVAMTPELVAVARRVRHRMGDVARRGYWRRLLNQYARVPQQWRWFGRTDAATTRVVDDTVFAPHGSALCTDRLAVYDAALTDPLQYRPTEIRPPAPAGRRYTFPVDGGMERVHLPDTLPPTEPAARLPIPAARGREPWNITMKELFDTGGKIDDLLVDKPHITNRNWVYRLQEKMRFSAVDKHGTGLIHSPESFDVDGLEHIVGLMNSGKTTLTDALTINRVAEHGNRVGMVVGSVGDVYAKVSFLRSLGIDAVPLIGRSSRGEHAARYWRTAVEESDILAPDEDHPADPAAAYANMSCLLEPFRRSSRPDWQPLDPSEFPCHGRLEEMDTEDPITYDCPLLSVCPTQKAHREIATAQVWVTTAQCLIASRAEPADASMRWFEAFQAHTDLLIIDEADAVQQVLDSRFVQTEPLVAAGKGWTHRMVDYTNAAMDAQHMAPAPDDEVARWYRQLQIHQGAVFILNRLALSEDGQPLKELLGDAPFTAHSLLRRVARTLFGLPNRGEGDKRIEDLADDFYRQELQDFAERPLDAAQHSLAGVVTAVTDPLREDESAVAAAIDAWLDLWLHRHIAAGFVTLAWFAPHRAMLRLIVEAAVCAGRISTTFFTMTTMYPSVRDRLRLPDEETFWADQPPRDYRPLVPEAPMGNILALRWADSRDGGASLQLLWVHGIGRWLLHHAHDLLACEGIQGPHVILTSATSWTPGSSFYHIPHGPMAVLQPPAEDQKALHQSHLTVAPQYNGSTPIQVSGRTGQTRHDALRLLTTALCQPVNGRSRSLVDELRAKLPEDRRKILFVVLSGAEARTVGDHINNRVPHLSARIVVPDAADPGHGGIQRRLVGRFGKTTDDILVAAEMSIQRGYNILNAKDTAALGAVIYLTRSHPPPFDLAFPLSIISQLAIDHLLHPPTSLPGQIGQQVKQLRDTARKAWYDAIGRPIQFRSLNRHYRRVFVANNLVPMSQTIGRSIRGNQPTEVLLCDAAFAERLSTPGEETPDTARTSIVIATDQFLTDLLAAPPRTAGDRPDRHREHAVNTAVWQLMGHLFQTNEPLGSNRSGT